MKPYYRDKLCTLYHGNALELLPTLPSRSVSTVLTDPPYSSGGLHRSDRNQRTNDKYVLNGTAKQYLNFQGDNRDQRSFLAWTMVWLGQCHRLVVPGGGAFIFTDWRQLPTLTDAIQGGGFVWRGIIPWDKTSASRPSKGWFRAQCEYLLTATRESRGKEQESSGACLDGFWRQAVNGSAEEKLHSTGKPVELHQWLLQVAKPGAVLDPFVGSGTTLRAAKNLGLPCIGIEIEESICEVAAKRLQQECLTLA